MSSVATPILDLVTRSRGTGVNILRELNAEMKAIEAQQEAIAKERARAKKELAHALKRRQAESPEHAKKAAAAEAEIRRLHTEFQKAIEAQSIIRQKAENELFLLDRGVQTLEAFLIRTSADRIFLFFDELDGMAAETREAAVSDFEKSLEPVEPDRITRKSFARVTRCWNNQPAIDARLAAIAKARADAEALRFELIDDGAVAKRLDAARASIPSADTLKAMTPVV